MEGLSDQLPAQPDQPTFEKLLVDVANDFLTACDGTGRPAPVNRLRHWLLLGGCSTGVAHRCWLRKMARLICAPT